MFERRPSDIALVVLAVASVVATLLILGHTGSTIYQMLLG